MTDVLQIWLHCFHPQNGTQAQATVYWLAGNDPVRSNVVEAKTVHDALDQGWDFLCQHAVQTGRSINVIVCHKSLITGLRQSASEIIGCTLTYKPLSEFPQPMLDFRNKCSSNWAAQNQQQRKPAVSSTSSIAERKSA